MTKKQAKMDLDTYILCCNMYAKIVISDCSDPKMIIEATNQFQVAYIALIDQGFDAEKLKNIFAEAAQVEFAVFAKSKPAI